MHPMLQRFIIRGQCASSVAPRSIISALLLSFSNMPPWSLFSIVIFQISVVLLVLQFYGAVSQIQEAYDNVHCEFIVNYCSVDYGIKGARNEIVSSPLMHICWMFARITLLHKVSFWDVVYESWWRNIIKDEVVRGNCYWNIVKYWNWSLRIS